MDDYIIVSKRFDYNFSFYSIFIIKATDIESALNRFFLNMNVLAGAHSTIHVTHAGPLEHLNFCKLADGSHGTVGFHTLYID